MQETESQKLQEESQSAKKKYVPSFGKPNKASQCPAGNKRKTSGKVINKMKREVSTGEENSELEEESTGRGEVIVI